MLQEESDKDEGEGYKGRIQTWTVCDTLESRDPTTTYQIDRS